MYKSNLKAYLKYKKQIKNILHFHSFVLQKLFFKTDFENTSPTTPMFLFSFFAYLKYKKQVKNILHFHTFVLQKLFFKTDFENTSPTTPMFLFSFFCLPSSTYYIYCMYFVALFPCEHF